MPTQLPRVPSLIPSSFATLAIGRDVSITIFTASSLNSGEKLFFGRGNYFTFPDVHPIGWTVRKLRGTPHILMPEPERDDADVVAGDAHVHGPGVAEQVREQAFAGQGWLVLRRDFLVFVQPGLEAVAGQLPAGWPASGEQRVSGLAAGVV